MIASLLGEPIDWECLLQEAARHRLTSMLYRRFAVAHQEAVPRAIYSRLHEHYLKSARLNLRLTAELLRILDLFEKHEIPAIPFKGPALAYALHEDPALREFLDLDILVRKEDVFKALALAATLGYPGIPSYSPAAQARILDGAYHYEIQKEDVRTCLEIHWGVLPPYYVLPHFAEGWWARVASLPIGSHRIPNLTPEDTLMALSAHGCKHRWHALSMIADVAQLLRRSPGLDWDCVFSRYRHPDLTRMILIGLLMTHHFRLASLPSEILEPARRDRVASGLARQCVSRLFLPQAGPGALHYMRFHLELKSRWLDRARFCYRILGTPRWGESGIVLPRFAEPFRGVLRWIRDSRSEI